MNGISFLVLRDHKGESVGSFGNIQFGQVEGTVNFRSFQKRVVWNTRKNKQQTKKKTERQASFLQNTAEGFKFRIS